MSEKIARDIARTFGIHVEWAPANREYVVDTRPFGTAKEARKYARSLSRMRTLTDYRIVNDMSNDTQTRNILAVIRKAERDGVVIDDGNVVDLIADNITSFTTLNDIRAALVRAGLASRFPRATRQRNPARRKRNPGGMQIQQQFFPDGGFVLHKISGNTSAWYDREGNLLDAEFRDARGNTRKVKRSDSSGSKWNYLKVVGKAWTPVQKNPQRRARKKIRAKTRATVRYKITAQNKGKRMHFDGRNFSERPTVKSFALVEDAKQTAFALIRRYPILRKYRVRVESFP